MPTPTARALCAELEAVGLLEQDASRRYLPREDPDTLCAGADELAHRYEIVLREDQRRLAAMAAYATSADCRSQFLRRWFGEPQPPRCGLCDRCTALAAVHGARASG
jgi:ATP-dependent DNA helicase RecQ